MFTVAVIAPPIRGRADMRTARFPTKTAAEKAAKATPRHRAIAYDGKTRTYTVYTGY